MDKTVIGTFSSRQQAEEAVSRLTARGVDRQEISLVAKNGGQAGSGQDDQHQAGGQTGWSPAGDADAGDRQSDGRERVAPGNDWDRTTMAGTQSAFGATGGAGHRYDDEGEGGEGRLTLGGARGSTAMGGVDEVADGISTGTLLGGLGGLLVGAGALAIPGLGPIIAAGPIAAALTGAVSGGVAGGLLDFGIPAERGRHYEREVKNGKILAVIRAGENQVDDAVAILRQYGASDVEVH